MGLGSIDKALIEEWELLKDLKRVYEEFGYVNTPLYEREGNYGIYYINLFGGMKKLLPKIGVEWNSYKKTPKHLFVKDVMRVYREHGYLKQDMYVKYGLYSRSQIKTHFGTFNNMLKELGLQLNVHHNATKEEVIESCKKLYDQYGYLDARLQREKSGYSQKTVDTLFGSFNNLLSEMGLEANYVRMKEENMIAELRSVYNTYGCLSKGLVDEYCSVTYEAMSYRFGGLEGILKAIGIDSKEYRLKNSSTGVSFLATVLGEYLGETPEFEKTWDWLVNDRTGRHMYADLFFESKNLVVEYDGEQHYNYIEYFHKTYDEFLDLQYRDRLKNRLYCDHGYDILRVRWDEPLNREYIISRLADL
ncbi:hypothetical protein QB910_000055 [Dabrowskivirus KKP3916]|uniref:DUF559 domain-containing protein n=1 Tax=Alicyclobacillus phage KKP_3916 TaxID=3040651 RepID=A0AAT9V7J8_9CAUD|nr:hypothetical protein QB910_000055 [Alicyclobacillus phage KKP 3916]